MKVTIGKEGLTKTWQNDFPEIVPCIHCGEDARVGFVAHEGLEEELDYEESVCSLYPNEPRESFWLHDCASFAIYICRKCIKGTVIWNQG